ncbi:MAG: acetylxylan esterase [Verrucomicrobia bacterium]|nr:acetylxylan esterase [Verrucomicrobiota bacterium]
MRRIFLLLPLLSSICLADGLTVEQERIWRAQIRSNFFIAGPLPSLAAQTHRRFEPASGVTAEAVTYASQFGMHVPAILYLPKPMPKGGKIPGFIVVNGHGGDKYSWYAFYTGVTYARAGAAVLTFDPAGEGERNKARKSGTRAHDGIKGDEQLARRLCGLLMSDVMQGVSYLSSRPEVDATRIGAGGYSLGSFVLALTGAVETRLRACVLVGGGNLDGPNEYWDNAKPMCQGLPYRSLNFLGDRPAAIYALHAARGPTLMFNGLADSVVNMQNTPPPFFKNLRERTVKLRGKADGVFETGFVPAVSHRPFFITKPVALWLERQLDFPNWTAREIETMPETHISEWAATNGAAMDKLYATEQREGGVRAVGTGVPGLTREQLSVLSDDEWERRKEEFVIEKWVEAAKAVK